MSAYSRSVKQFCNTIYFSLFNLFFKNNNCIIEISSLDKSHFKKRFKFMEEHKCTALAYFFFKIIY